MSSHALVVDDSRAMRLILGRLLREVGFDVVEAGDGREALDRLLQIEQTSVALVDWNMPVMNGYEFIKAVRGRDEWRDVTLIMVTTETEMDQVVRALAAGANEYVMKPFTREVIMDKLELLGLVTRSPVG